MRKIIYVILTIVLFAGSALGFFDFGISRTKFREVSSGNEIGWSAEDQIGWGDGDTIGWD